MRALVLALPISLLTTVSAGAQVASFSTSHDTIMPSPTTVLIEKANVPGNGLVIVREIRRGSIQPASLGMAKIAQGETTNLVIKLNRPPSGTEDLIVMLHADHGRRGVYDGDPTVLSVEIPRAVVRRVVAAR